MTNSIVISVHNKAHYMDVFLKRIRITAPKAELVLVDDGSTDGTGDILRRHADIFLETPDVWETKANNAGLRAATGDVVAIVQDDDLILSPGWLEIAADAMEKYGIGVLSGRNIGHYYFKAPPTANESSYLSEHPVAPCDNHGEPLAIVGVRGNCMHDLSLNFRRYNVQKQPVLNARTDSFITFCDATIRSPFIISRPLIDAIGYFDEFFAPLSYDDHDYCFRAREKGFAVAFTQIPQASRFGGGSKELYSTPAKLKIFDDATTRNLYELLERYHTSFTDHGEGMTIRNACKATFWVPDLVENVNTVL